MKLCNYQQYYFSRMLSLPSCFHEDKYFNTSKAHIQLVNAKTLGK